MTDRELKKLNRRDLLKMLIFQTKRNEELKAKLQAAEEKLSSRNIDYSDIGSISQAALRLSGVFEAADEAALRYLDSIKNNIGGKDVDPATIMEGIRSIKENYVPLSGTVNAPHDRSVISEPVTKQKDVKGSAPFSRTEPVPEPAPEPAPGPARANEPEAYSVPWLSQPEENEPEEPISETTAETAAPQRELSPELPREAEQKAAGSENAAADELRSSLSQFCEYSSGRFDKTLRSLEMYLKIFAKDTLKKLDKETAPLLGTSGSLSEQLSDVYVKAVENLKTNAKYAYKDQMKSFTDDAENKIFELFGKK